MTDDCHILEKVSDVLSSFRNHQEHPNSIQLSIDFKIQEPTTPGRYLNIWRDSPVDSEQEVADGDGDWIPDWADLNSVKFQYSKTFICRKDTSHWHCSSFSSLSWLPWTPNSVRFRISLQRVVKGRNLEQKGRIFFVIVTSSESLYWTDYCYFYILPVDNSLLGVLETKNTNTESGKLYQ